MFYSLDDCLCLYLQARTSSTQTKKFPIRARHGFSLLYILLVSNDLVNDLIMMIIAGSPESGSEPVSDHRDRHGLVRQPPRPPLAEAGQ